MKKILKKILPDFYLDYVHRFRIDENVKQNFHTWREISWKKWIEGGEQIPPPHPIKQKVISDYQKKYNVKTLIETGTLHGEMIEAQKRSFDTIYSIELDQKLYCEATERFKYDRDVHLVLGDSGKKIFDIIDSISGIFFFPIILSCIFLFNSL